MKAIFNKVLFMILDAIIVNMGLFAALLLRFDAAVPQAYLDIYLYSFIPVTFFHMIIFYSFGLYSRLWIYASVGDINQIMVASLVGMTASFYTVYIIDILLPCPVYLIAWFIISFLSVGLRLSSRAIKRIHILKSQSKEKKRVMIVGAGDAGSLLIKEMKNNQQSEYTPIVVIDDDKSKHKTKINGVLVLGGRDSIIHAVKELNIEEIIIAIPSIPRKEIGDIIKICRQTPCKIKVLPGIYHIIDEKVSIKEINDVNIEDLLRREVIDLNTQDIAHYLKGETVLVTGGGGSIGSELCRQIADYMPRLLLVFDIYENNVYELQNELKKMKKVNSKVIIGSIRDKARLAHVFTTYHPTIVFHAAAHKHVPLMEENPGEAIKNNIYGTLNVAECADKYHSKKFVLISTDKAVNPVSIMGATKRIAEIIIQYMNQHSNTRYSAVRFGNVLGSNGSVIPLFVKQIQQGGPVTVTHPEMTRYFMTIPEASNLVLQAAAMACGGEIFVLDMGEPVKIADLAKDLITLSGFEPGVDINIDFTGLRPGEKLYEELLFNEKGVEITKNNKIFIENPQNLDYESLFKEITLFKNNDMKNIDEIRKFIKRVVPTYQKKAKV